MNREYLINFVTNELVAIQQTLIILELLVPGYLYCFHFLTSYILGRPRNINHLSVNWEVFACNSRRSWLTASKEKFFETWAYNVILDLKRVPREEYNEYSSYLWKSREFIKLLDGTSRLKLK